MKNLGNETNRLEILRRLEHVRPESAGRWGKMNAHQMICHLSDSFKVCLGEKPVSHTGNVLHRTLMKWFALYVPLRWPQGVPTRPEVDQEHGGTAPSEFERDRVDLVTTLERFLHTPRQRHPVFGEMSERDWLRWGYLHLDHHLRQFGL
jgi:Protein of unknown function (DUF1569)